MKDYVPDYQLGEVVPGTNDAGDEINAAQEGRTYEHQVTERVVEALNMRRRPIGRRVFARILRNQTGRVILPGEVVSTDPANGVEGLGRATAIGELGAKFSFVVDAMIPAAGVPIDDLFYGILEGPAGIRMADGGTDVTAGATIQAGAAGRGGVGGTIDTQLGTSLEDSTAAENDGKFVIIDMWTAWA